MDSEILFSDIDVEKYNIVEKDELKIILDNVEYWFKIIQEKSN